MNFNVKYLFTIFLWLLLQGPAFSAHIDEPLNTEIPATPPRERVFIQLETSWERFKKEGVNLDQIAIPLSFEFGLSEKEQFNLELTSSPLERKLAEEDTSPLILTNKSAVSEISIGYKQRFLNETKRMPDMAFEIEFAPIAERGNAVEAKALLIMGKILSPKWRIYTNIGYKYEKEKGEPITHTIVSNFTPVYTLVPEKLHLLLEVNKEISFHGSRGGRTKTQIVPEAIWVPWPSHRTALKFGIPIGITKNNLEYGVQLAISRLF